MKKKVLFLCTGNSCRSQMAEGWVRHLRGDDWDAFSAGTDPQGLNPLAAEVMAECGVDISAQASKSLQRVHGMVFDLVVTVCDRARESCPFFSGARRMVHAGFPDPPDLAGQMEASPNGGGDGLEAYRFVRDAIREWVEDGGVLGG